MRLATILHCDQAKVVAVIDDATLLDLQAEAQISEQNDEIL
jgi:hypothetical protein